MENKELESQIESKFKENQYRIFKKSNSKTTNTPKMP